MRYGAFLLLFQRVYCSKRQEDPLRLLSCLRFFLQYPKAVKNYDALFFSLVIRMQSGYVLSCIRHRIAFWLLILEAFFHFPPRHRHRIYSYTVLSFD